jgi:hypothetical protein
MSVILNGNTYTLEDFVGPDGRGYTNINPDTGLPFFPDSIFSDMLEEIDQSLNSYDIGAFFYRQLIGEDVAGVMFGTMIVRNVTFADDFAGSFSEAQTGALNERIFNIQKNDITVGTLTYPSGGQTNGVLATSGGSVQFLVGDKLTIVSPGGDSNLDAISLTLKG